MSGIDVSSIKLSSAAKVDGAHSDNIWNLSWTASGKLLSGSLDGTVKLWSLNDDKTQMKCQTTAKKYNKGVISMTTVQNGSLTLVCYQDSTIKIYSTENLVEVSSIHPGLLEAWGICLSPADDFIASGTHKGKVNIWSIQEGHEKVAQLETHNQFILSTAFNIDGKLATSSVDGYVNVFDVETKQIIHKVEAHAMPARSVTFSPDGTLIYTASDDRHVSIYDTVSCSIVQSFSHGAMARSVDVSQDQRHFVVGCADGTVSRWDLGLQKCLSTAECHKDQVWSVKFDKTDAKYSRFATAGDDSSIQIFE